MLGAAEEISRAEMLAALAPAEQKEALAALDQDAVVSLLYDWRFWARPKQLEPEGAWRVWLMLAGRGFGKTRAGAEWVRRKVEARQATRIALVAPTAADARDVMIEGESGLLAISPPDFRPHYEPSKRRLTWPNGAVATAFSADEPSRLRGPQFDAAWCDELAAWRYEEAWDMLMLGLRLGSDPRAVVTTTPKPTRLVKNLVNSPGTVAVTRGATRENRRNLAPAFLAEIARRYDGTRLGRQELEAEILEDAPGALWRRDMFEREGMRLKAPPSHFEKLVSNTAPPRSPDFYIPLFASAYAANDLALCQDGLVRLPPNLFEVLIQNNSGVSLPSSGNKIVCGPVAVQY